QPLDALELGHRERARFARRQVAEFEWADLDAFEAQDLVIELGKHAADLAVLAFGEDDAQPGAVALSFQAFDLARLDMPLAEVNAFEQLLQIVGRGIA